MSYLGETRADKKLLPTPYLWQKQVKCVSKNNQVLQRKMQWSHIKQLGPNNIT